MNKHKAVEELIERTLRFGMLDPGSRADLEAALQILSGLPRDCEIEEQDLAGELE